jgi:hypothetical protein
MTEQAVQILGAVLILAAFVLAQARVLTQDSYAYLVPNLLGALVLTADAWLGRQWGFVLLEGVWAIVSFWGIVARARGGRAAAH